MEYYHKNGLHHLIIFEPKPRQEGYSLILTPSQLIVCRDQIVADQPVVPGGIYGGRGMTHWYPFRLRWWPDFRPYHRKTTAFLNMGWKYRKHYSDDGRTTFPQFPWNKRKHDKAVEDFADAARAGNLKAMDEAASRQLRYRAHTRR